MATLFRQSLTKLLVYPKDFSQCVEKICGIGIITEPFLLLAVPKKNGKAGSGSEEKQLLVTVSLLAASQEPSLTASCLGTASVLLAIVRAIRNVVCVTDAFLVSAFSSCSFLTSLPSVLSSLFLTRGNNKTVESGIYPR